MVKSILIKAVFLSIIAGIFCQKISAQKSFEKTAFTEAARLKNGVLIVRFPVYAPKIRFLKNKLNASSSEKIRAKIKKQLQEVYDLNEYKFRLLDSIMEKEFRFTRVVYMPDSLYKSFLNGNRIVFLNSEGVIDSNISIGEDYYLMISGIHDDQWVLVDEHLNIPEPPFPHRIIVFLSGIRRVFAREKYYQIQIKGFNKKLSKLIE